MSNASGTLWLDVQQRDWSDALLALTHPNRSHRRCTGRCVLDQNAHIQPVSGPFRLGAGPRRRASRNQKISKCAGNIPQK
ncbi:hypothetical protein [Rhodoferax aquaticus]